MTRPHFFTATDDTVAPLFDPLKLGALELPNRVLMAPLTRNRAHADGRPGDLAATYYAQRASAGLIISEATQINPVGKGYKDTPGIYTDDHVAGWRQITDAVHEADGRIFCQLWHVGRISHTSLQPNGGAPLSPSAVRAASQTFTEGGFEDTSEPREMSIGEIRDTVADYAHAARRAIEAGFDGVEIHGANGYLIDQFLQENTNLRTDDYGGSIDKATRFLREVVESVSAAIGAERVGLRLSPTGTFGDINSSMVHREAVFSRVVDALSPMGLAYLHFVERFRADAVDPEAEALIAKLSKAWTGLYVANGDFGPVDGARAIAEGPADAVAFGRPFIANPDLPRRYATNAPLNEPDQTTFYGGDAEGYTDYSFLDGSTRAA